MKANGLDSVPPDPRTLTGGWQPAGFYRIAAPNIAQQLPPVEETPQVKAAAAPSFPDEEEIQSPAADEFSATVDWSAPSPQEGLGFTSARPQSTPPPEVSSTPIEITPAAPPGQFEAAPADEAEASADIAGPSQAAPSFPPAPEAPGDTSEPSPFAAPAPPPEDQSQPPIQQAEPPSDEDEEDSDLPW